ncbi:HD family phosphohydrolase [Pasteuria penetrans]|uniref:HD family phosphohydrolase n=1 Tax=Pasteuria penetrans TaxID=86005 RepID=UPI000F9381C1|nr:HDIG domain-containing metalloprotein [Pasteuria penetrans]
MEVFRRIRVMAWMKRVITTRVWHTHAGVRFGLYFLFVAFSCGLLLGHVNLDRHDFAVGTASPDSKFAPFTTIDFQATGAARKRAEQAVEPQYSRDDQKAELQKQRIDRLFRDLEVARNSSQTEQQKLRDIRTALDDFQKDVMAGYGELGEDTVGTHGELSKIVLHIPQDKLSRLRTRVRKMVGDLFAVGIRPENESQVHNRVPRIVRDEVHLNEDEKTLVMALIQQSLVPNEMYDEEETARQKRVARDRVQPIPLLRGQTIVSKGEIIKADQWKKLEQFGFLSPGLGSVIAVDAGLILLMVIIVSLLAGYVHRFHSFVARDNRKLLLLLLILSFTLLLCKVLALLVGPLRTNLLGYAAPVALCAMLITLLLDARLSLASVALVAILVGILFHNFSENPQFLFDLRFALAAFVSGAITTTILMRMIRQRGRILLVGIVAAVATWLPIVAGYLVVPADGSWTRDTMRELGESLLWGTAGGLTSAILALGFLPYLETLFGVLSPMRLVELCNPNHPLLKKLLLQTPGTYHHSIMVANLAELASEAVGADGLLARVGAYYHDIGKTKRPHFFIENQPPGSTNPHNALSPYLSRSIIIAHVREGVAILRDHRIPEPIRDIAAQHHGTTLLRFFYYRALQQASKGGDVSQEDFRYPGPRACSREAAIVGIADCVEAATRSLQGKATPARIEELVRKLVRERLDDGQLDECELTLKDLEKITRSMIMTLQGIFHTRIVYPSRPEGKKGG